MRTRVIFIDLRTLHTHTTPCLIGYRYDGNRGHRENLFEIKLEEKWNIPLKHNFTHRARRKEGEDGGGGCYSAGVFLELTRVSSSSSSKSSGAV